MRRTLEALASTLGILLSLALGCRHTETKIEQLYEKVLSQKDPAPIEINLDRLEKRIIEIIQKNKIPYVHSVHIYTEQEKEKFSKKLTTLMPGEDKPYFENLMNTMRRIQDNCDFYLLMSNSVQHSIIIALNAGLSKRVKRNEDLESLVKFYLGHKLKEHAEGINMKGEKLDKNIMFKDEIKRMIYFTILDYRAIVNYLIETKRNNIPLSLENVVQMRKDYLIAKRLLRLAAEYGSGYAQLALEAARERILEYNAQVQKK